MQALETQSAVFPAAHCDNCGRSVLTCLTWEENGEGRCCAHCGQAITAELEWLDAAAIEELGYYFGAPPKARGGCSSGGCGSCSR